MGSRGQSSQSAKASSKKETYKLAGGLSGRVSENQIVDYMRMREGYSESQARTAIQGNQKLKTRMAKNLLKEAIHLYPEDFR
jgi:hypothetical protein